MSNISSIAKRLLEVAPDALLVVDALGLIQFSNETSSTLFGYTPLQLVGQSILILIPARFHHRHSAHLATFSANPTNREMGARIKDLYARRADGSEFPAGIRLSPFRDEGNDYVAASIRDMTERTLITDELLAAREAAERANRAKSRFLATASHDLRQPLQAIRLLNASLQTLTPQSQAIIDVVRHQQHAIDSAVRLLNALLDISRLESGSMQPQLAEVNLSAAFDDLMAEFQATALDKHLELTFPPTQVVISTDRILFAQLLQNLISNALKYTAIGYVRILKAFEVDALVLTIADSGQGIPEDKVDRIFDEYYQVGAHGIQPVGVGLGLAIVREVTRLLGYSIAVESTVGCGTAVSIRIPRHRIVTEAATRIVERDRTTEFDPSSCRLILLEDNNAVRKATELFLTLAGFEVQCAATVSEGRRMLEHLQPRDVFITDYHLDDSLTGLDVLMQLRQQQGRDVPLHLAQRRFAIADAKCQNRDSPLPLPQ
jgi:PAS domain S-box-containing protein